MTCSAAAYVITALLHVAVGQAVTDRPNVILIVADDLGFNDVSFHGSRQIPTPNIDALAYSGIILNNYYVQPICTPTRSTLMTGRIPIHTGLQHSVIVGSAPYGLGLNETVMPQYLKEMGYATHIVGKWHLGFFAKEYTPLYRGFDSHFGYYQGMEDYYDHSYFTAPPKGYPMKDGWGLDFRRDMDLVKTAYGQYSTELFTQEAETIIQKHNTSQPLFMYLPHQAVHSGDPITPLEAPWKYLEKLGHIKDKNRRLFAGMVSALDDSIGNITKALNDKGMLNNSIIIFTTDNGGPAAGFDMNHASNWPLRGVKATMWEGGTRGAGFIWSPLLKQKKYTSSAMVHVSDWLPTILRAAGYDMSKLMPKQLDGFDQWEVLSGNRETQRKEMLLNIDPIDKSSAIRINEMKLVKGLDYKEWNGWYRPEGYTDTKKETGAPKHMFRNKELEMILYNLGMDFSTDGPAVVQCNSMPPNASVNCQPEKAACLFNITADPCEYNNLAQMYPEIVLDLEMTLAAHETTMVSPKNKPQDPKGLPSFHGGAWVPWVELGDSANFIN